jgi:O-glycosyl hydrolase
MRLALAGVLALSGIALLAFSAPTEPLAMKVDFGQKVRDWDGFGVNYVETHQTRDYRKLQDEYGGFSLLSQDKREKILDMVFGADGLRPSLIKMFLDPFHEGYTEAGNDNQDPNVINMARFDHQTTTAWMRFFAKQGLARTRKRGDGLTIITTMYGPMPWGTKQKFVRGRDLDPAMKYEVAEYMISWVKYLRETEKLPVKYISLHNEGESPNRWDPEAKTSGDAKHDHNMWWPPEQVVDFLKFMRPMLDKQGLKDVGIANGEPSSWVNFNNFGYAKAILADPVALQNLGLITSHGFGGAYRSEGTDALRNKRPELHAWTPSGTWGKMDVSFVDNIRGQIYENHVNGFIPWAVLQRPVKWMGGDPNPGTAFNVREDGTYSVERGYFFYKQVCPVGQAGMAVATVSPVTGGVGLIGFAANGTRHPDAFVVINTGDAAKDLTIQIAGSKAKSFRATRTSPGEQSQAAGQFDAKSGSIAYSAPAGSVTTFVAR